MNPWILLLVLGLCSFALRGVVVLAFGGRELPPNVQRASSALAPAILAAMLGASIASSLFGSTADGIGGVDLERLGALIAAAFIASRTASAAWALVVGLLSYLALCALPL